MKMKENGGILISEREKRYHMLAEERFSAIVKIVEAKRTVTVQELTELLETSESTIRRDLTELH